MKIHDKIKEFYYSSSMREGILCWYPFESGRSALDMSNGALRELLNRRGLSVFEKCSAGRPDNFDYIVLIDPDSFETAELESLRLTLSPKGRLLMAFENPFGLRYFSGKLSPFAKKPFHTVTGKDSWPGMAEAKIRLREAGFKGQKWYYPLTDHWFATEIYSENHLPNEFLNQRFLPYVCYDSNVLFDERTLYKEIIRGGAFEFMCGAYLVEARVSDEDKPCPIDYAALTSYRESSKQFATTIRNDGTVQKMPLCNEGIERARMLARNHDDLAVLGVNVVEVKLQGDTLVMPRIDLPTLCDYWARKIAEGTFNESEMFRLFDAVRDAIYKACRNGRCYWELVPANCFYDENIDELLFFDQEYYWDGVTPDFAVARAIGAVLYSPAIKADTRSKGWYEALKAHYGLCERWSEYVKLLQKTYIEVFGERERELLKVSGTLELDNIFKRGFRVYEKE